MRICSKKYMQQNQGEEGLEKEEESEKNEEKLDEKEEEKKLVEKENLVKEIKYI
tara:strand:+ start:55 stop:216 length:162 start_codon:yes stop_codon:yes gene_type:complete